MTAANTDRLFAGSIPELYERCLVPLIFAPYAIDLAARVVARAPRRVLEVACGTGVVTRELALRLPRDATIVATDLNQPMLDQAAAVGTARAIEWRQADALQLPFDDASFDAVVCQFGVMFFPDKPAGYAQARRVLHPGGAFLFNAWDAIEHNELTATVIDALAVLFPIDPPRFLARTPHGYHDRAAIERDLALGGFAAWQIETVSARSRADSAHAAAFALCQGTPLRPEIEARGPGRLAEATDVAAAAIVRRFGSGAIDAKIQAHVVVAVDYGESGPSTAAGPASQRH
ncbi:MAG TPA: methyltransferase domain-containing protein [Burkholderiaceae bacterium]|nr:methyltransferase domain-containing protein [Burkholderiaceae bacterium]